jgi:uncharacterized membrane protein
MDESTQRLLARWKAAGLLDPATAERIESWEAAHAPAHSSRLGRFAFAFGGLMLGAGVLLFVAANWDELSPWARFATLAGVVAILHVGGVLVESRSAALAQTLHAVGTGALGGGIFLAAQAFNLAENWPSGLLLWAIGAAFALWIRRDWPHVLWVATLVPMWLATEWIDRVGEPDRLEGPLLFVGLSVLSVAYASAVGPTHDDVRRRALARLGATLLVPFAILLMISHQWVDDRRTMHATATLVLGWGVAVVLPLLAGAWLRGRAAWPLLPALAIAIAITQLGAATGIESVVSHLLYAAAAAGLVWWGVSDRHRLRINLGVLGFALTVMSFYYSNVLDKFGRSLGLIGLGALFIVGGWWLERTRQSLLGRIEETPP